LERNKVPLGRGMIWIFTFVGRRSEILRVTWRPATPVGIIKGFATWISLLVIHVTVVPISIPLIGHAEAPMWHLDEETLNLPDVSLGQPPVVVAQIGQIADAKADDTPREVDEGLGVTVNQFSKGVENRLPAVQARIARACHRAPLALFPVKKKDVIQVVL